MVVSTKPSNNGMSVDIAIVFGGVGGCMEGSVRVRGVGERPQERTLVIWRNRRESRRGFFGR